MTGKRDRSISERPISRCLWSHLHRPTLELPKQRAQPTITIKTMLKAQSRESTIRSLLRSPISVGGASGEVESQLPILNTKPHLPKKEE